MAKCFNCFPDDKAIKKKRAMRSLEFASDAQKSDEAFVMEKVRKNGLALKFASDALRGAKAVVALAAEQNLLALKYASDTLRHDHGIIMASLKVDKDNWVFVDQILGGENEVDEFVLKAVKEETLSLRNTPEKFRSHDAVLEAVKRDGLSLRWAPDKLKGDRQIVLEAVKRDGRAWQFASDELREDKEVLMEAVRRDQLAKGKGSEKVDHEAADEGDAGLAMWRNAVELCQDRAITLAAGDPAVRKVDCAARTQ